jgi:hypothetical protein
MGRRARGIRIREQGLEIISKRLESSLRGCQLAMTDLFTQGPRQFTPRGSRPLSAQVLPATNPGILRSTTTAALGASSHPVPIG